MDFKELKRRAIRQGWRIVVTGKNHLKWYSPKGGMVVTGGTPSDVRAIKNTIARMRREGFDG